MSPEDPRHGTVAGYIAHRKAKQETCAACRAARTKYEKRRRYEFGTGRPRLIDATGSKRRLQGLVALGWTYRPISELLGITADGVHKTLTGTDVIRQDVADRIAVVYDEMSMALPPRETKQQKRDASYAQTVARRHGWLPPLVWDDIDNPNESPGQPDSKQPIRGRVPVLPDQIEDFDWLLQQGESEQSAASRIGVRLDSFRDQRRRHEREAS